VISVKKMGLKSIARNHKEQEQGRNEESKKTRDEKVIGVLTSDVSCVDVLDAHL
jgi:hypothetical protein